MNSGSTINNLSIQVKHSDAFIPVKRNMRLQVAKTWDISLKQNRVIDAAGTKLRKPVHQRNPYPETFNITT